MKTNNSNDLPVILKLRIKVLIIVT